MLWKLRTGFSLSALSVLNSHVISASYFSPLLPCGRLAWAERPCAMQTCCPSPWGLNSICPVQSYSARDVHSNNIRMREYTYIITIITDKVVEKSFLSSLLDRQRKDLSLHTFLETFGSAGCHFDSHTTKVHFPFPYHIKYSPTPDAPAAQMKTETW